MRFLLSLLTVSIGILVFTSDRLLAQSQASLVADVVAYDQKTSTIRATGNVQVFYRETKLIAEQILYDEKQGKIKIIGPFTLHEGETVTLFGDNAVLDSKLQNGIIKNVHLLMDQQLQIAAVEYRRNNSRISTAEKVVASSCYICENNPTPFWKINAARIIHDSQKQRIYFENARLDFLGFPIFYTPKLSIPEPGVTRDSGFLVPSFKSGNRLGISTKIPYYLKLNKHSDATITPFVTTKGSAILEGQYRRRTKNGAYQIAGAFALKDDLSDRNLNGFIKSVGTFALRNNVKLEYGVFLTSEFDKVNKTSFLDNYDYGDDDRLTNFITITKTTRNRFVELGSSFTQSLRANEVDTDIPVVLPEFQYTRTYVDPLFNGKLNLTAQSVSLIRDADSSYSRIGLRADWDKNWVLDSGILLGASSQINSNVYYFNGAAKVSALPVIALEARYPLHKVIGNATHVIEPIAQIIWSPNEAFGTSNLDATTSDSTTAEFEETNLFSINRFPGFDETEAGVRANIGLRYQRYDPSGWTFGATVGRVFRTKDLGQFNTSTSTGLDNLNSDFVAAFNLDYQDMFRLLSRMLVDDDFNVSKNETKISYKAKRLSTDVSYVWLDQFTILGQPDSQHEISLKAAYQATDYWSITGSWRHNLGTGSPIEGELGAIYKNECAEVKFSVSLDYDSNGSVERDFGLKIAFAGLGSRNNKVNTAHRCGF